MANPQLQLSVVQVRIAKPDKTGHDPAPAGTRVFLDVPTGNIRDFNFQEFVVNAKGTLDAAGANAGKIVSIDSSVTYWSLWTPPSGSLTLPSKFDPDNLDVVTGFGRPLLAVLNNQKELILPNTRKLFFREFNLSGLGETKEMKINRQKATDFYKNLHIDLIFQAQPKPAGQSDVFLCAHTGKGMHLHDVSGLKNPAASPIVEVPLDKSPFTPDPANKAKTIGLIWVNSSLGSAVEGKAHHPHRFITSLNILAELAPSHTPDYSFIFMPATASMASASTTGGQGPEVLAHELGHVLWADAGAGREWYNNSTNLNDAERAAYQQRINNLFINDMGLDVKPDQVAGLLESNDHHHLPNNVMNAFPANTGKVPDAITFLQIGLFRLAPELAW
jgi:hypothetical protein